MRKILTPEAPLVEDQLANDWSDPEEIQDACIAVMDTCLGHDVERLAAVSGISRRELNKQRERRADRLGKQWMHRLALILRATSMKFGRERTAPAVRLLAHAAGHELAASVPHAAERGQADLDTSLLATTMREVLDAAAKFAAAAVDGVDRQEAAQLLPEFDEALDQLHAMRDRIAERAGHSTEVVTGRPGRTRA